VGSGTVVSLSDNPGGTMSVLEMSGHYQTKRGQLFSTELFQYSENRTLTNRYCSRGESMRFAYVTSLRVQIKQINVLCKPKTLPTQELRQRATKYFRWKIIFIVWAENASLSATPPTPVIAVPFTFNGTRAHRFVPTTVISSRSSHQL
jgi:hypothetical protein